MSLHGDSSYGEFPSRFRDKFPTEFRGEFSTRFRSEFPTEFHGQFRTEFRDEIPTGFTGAVNAAVTFFMAMLLLSERWVPLVRFLLLVIAVGAVGVTVAALLGPVGLGITSATGVAGTTVRYLGRKHIK